MRGIIILVLLTCLLMAGCAQEKPEQGGDEKISAKVLFIIAQKNFRDEELQTPKQLLEEAGADCQVSSVTTEPAQGMMGATVTPDLAVKDADITNYDMVVVVGGSGAPSLNNHPEVLELLRQAKQQNKIIGSLCLGPMVLAKAGVLEGKRATVFETAESQQALTQGGAEYVQQSVVVDGDLITANGPGAAEEFGQELVKKLQG